MSVFEKFASGKLYLPSGQLVELKSVAWSLHTKFAGVALKHIVTAKDTDGAFSYHLVRVAPQSAIGLHIHEMQLETHEVISGSGICNLAGHEMAYESGVVSVLPAGIEHTVTAGNDGLYLLAKFFPALC